MQNIGSENQKILQEYLDYCEKVRQNGRGTIKARELQLRHLSNWANETPLHKANEIASPFSFYLGELKTARDGYKSFAPATADDVANVARMFFRWARSEYAGSYGHIRESWIESLRPPRHMTQQGTLVEHQYYTLDEMQKIVTIQPQTMAEKRGIAAMAFLYLTGMRLGAFMTLPISCVDLHQHKIYQIPSMGVQTKFRKAAVTTLLNIPELLEIVKDWDIEVRARFPFHQTWFAPIRPQRENAGHLHITTRKASPLRQKELYKEIRGLCKRVEIQYKSPHKLRHGHAMYGIKNARSIRELKAISQNLMHESIMVTDGVYGNLSGDDFLQTVNQLGGDFTEASASDAFTNDLLRALLKLQTNPGLLKYILTES